jgi:hypothetical protein
MLYRWYHTWKEFPAWRPWPVDDRERTLRIFTAEEETVICEFIIANCVIPGPLFTNNDFRRITMEAFLTKYAESEQLPQFNCLNGFIKDFKWRNSFSSRRAHCKRRSIIDSRIEDAWLGEMREFMASVANLDRVVNCDEIYWRVYPDGLRTWALSGSDHVAISAAGDEKESFRVLCSIIAARRKLPIVMIANF